jgi:hypothetical protein
MYITTREGRNLVVRDVQIKVIGALRTNDKIPNTELRSASWSKDVQSLGVSSCATVCPQKTVDCISEI